MTIKRQLFISNIRIVIISVGAFGLIAHIITLLAFGSNRPDWETIDFFFETSGQYIRLTVWFLSFTFFLVLVSIVNSFFTHFMTKRIVKPLEPLNEGVRQIQNNNYAYRINYQNDDEFRPICEAFNEMAAKLEASTAKQKKDETNRRELIVGISHDLSTPLTSVLGCIEGIETGVAATPEKQKQYFTFIKNESIRMKHIIEQLFLFSKLDMDEFPLNLQQVNITFALFDMIDDSLVRYEGRGLSIHIDEMPKDILASVDIYLFHNTIINILENSVKYKTKKHGNMEISATVENNVIIFRFTDDGPGVEPEMLPNLLDVFYRADPSRSKKVSGGETIHSQASSAGSGLGLAISAKIIQRMGGKIFAELPPSRGLSACGGLTIVIQLPIVQGGIA